MSLREKFTKEMDVCFWNILDKNLERDAVILVEESLDIIDVAIALAENKVEEISNWLKNSQLRKLSIKNTDEFEKSTFNFLIVQPFVLVQEK